MRATMIGATVSAVMVAAGTLSAQQGATGGEWRSHGGDKGYTRYSPLSQINKDTVKDLRIAWRRPSVDADFVKQHPAVKFGNQLQSTPVMINGVLYAANAIGLVEAFDPATGRTLWVQELPEQEVMPSGEASRAVAYWRDAGGERLLSVRQRYLIAMDPKTGKMIRDFGDAGRVDLGLYADPEPLQGAPRQAGFKPESYRWRASPLVVGDVVIVGSAVSRAGDVRGYDVRTGKLKWTFNVVPLPGQLGHDTWLDESWKGIQAGEMDVWSMMSGDEELGLVYLPTSAATNNLFGGHRPGANLFSSSIICLRAATGERVWHFQTVHHDVWDYDNPTAPILMDINVSGRPVKALVQLTKQAMAFVLDRATGAPVWPIEERPVPASAVAGEWSAPTQPFPTKPAPYDRQGIGFDDLIDFTPALQEEAIQIAKDYRLGPIYNSQSVVVEGGKAKGSLQMPGVVGGTNWGGAAFDPETGILYVPSRTGAAAVTLTVPTPPTGQRYRGVYKAVEGPQGLPLTKPPYGRITAINMNTAEHLWAVPNGDGPRNHPALKHLNLPPLGQPGHGMPLVTSTLLFVSEGDPIMVVTPVGGGPDAGKKLRAYDKASGAVVWESAFPAGTNGSLMMYMHNGKQYIVFPIGSKEHVGEWIALSLP